MKVRYPKDKLFLDRALNQDYKGIKFLKNHSLIFASIWWVPREFLFFGN